MLFQTLVLSVVEYGFGLLILSKSQLNRLEVIQNEAMRAILGCTRDTSAEAMRYILGFPTMAERHKLAQVKAFLKVSADENHPLHQKVGNRPPSRLKRGSEWMTQATTTVENCVSINSIRRGKSWHFVDDYQENYSRVIATLGRECREWAPGETDEAVETLISENSQDGDAVVFTDGSVKRGEKSGWAFTVRCRGETVGEGSGAVEVTTSSMVMEIKAVTEALKYLQQNDFTRAVIITDSMSTLQKVEKEYMYADWLEPLRNSALQKITWIFSPGHAGVTGNERADSLAGSAAIDNDLVLDPPTVLQCVKENLLQNRPPSSSYTVTRLKEKDVQPGEGANCTHRGATRRRHNQLLTETISMHTLRWILLERSERLWGCPCCEDLNASNK